MTLIPATRYKRLSLLSFVISGICLCCAYCVWTEYDFAPKMAHKAAEAWHAKRKTVSPTTSISDADYTYLSVYCKTEYERRTTVMSPLALCLLFLSFFFLGLSLKRIDDLVSSQDVNL